MAVQVDKSGNKIFWVTEEELASVERQELLAQGLGQSGVYVDRRLIEAMCAYIRQLQNELLAARQKGY